MGTGNKRYEYNQALALHALVLSAKSWLEYVTSCLAFTLYEETLVAKR
jgi:hypothetical protein